MQTFDMLCALLFLFVYIPVECVLEEAANAKAKFID